MGGIVSRVFRGAPEHSNCQTCQRSCCICLDAGLELTQRRLLRLEERELRRSRAGSRASRRFLSDAEEEEEEPLEEEEPPRTRPASRRSQRRPAAQRPRRPAQSEPEEEPEEPEEEEEEPEPQPRQRPRARATVRRQAPARRPRRARPQPQQEEEEEPEEEPEPEPAPRPARASQRAQRQRTQQRRQRQPEPEEPEEEGNAEEEEEEQPRAARRPRANRAQAPAPRRPAARRRNNPPEEEEEEPQEEEEPAEQEQAPRRRQRGQRTRTQQRRAQRRQEEDPSTATEDLEEDEETGREARLRRLERRLLLEEDHLRERILREEGLRRQRSCRRRQQQHQMSLDRRQQRDPEPEVVRGPNVRRLVACYELKRSDISETDAQSLQNLFTQDSPLSSKVALFNQTAQSHRESQLSNPFSDAQATRGMARLQISKEEYGKPKAGSLTEYRGKKANIQVYQEMLELCQVIDTDGKPVSKKNPDIKMIYFGELFNIYTHINDKLVGLLLRARKHDLIQFEGECLFQRRDDHVPVYLTKPVAQIRDILVGKQTEIRRSLSPNPQPTNMLP
uniref:Costars domain-containing protein n=1 Tax=Anopheles culicifacies TaxID=139723 RepID=A0A182MIF5_9DIPT